eukprot:401848-Prymnesium_polylepis.1
MPTTPQWTRRHRAHQRPRPDCAQRHGKCPASRHRTQSIPRSQRQHCSAPLCHQDRDACCSYRPKRFAASGYRGTQEWPPTPDSSRAYAFWWREPDR